MGFKISMISIKEPATKISDTVLLQKLGFPDFSLVADTSFDESMYPRDNSINIGTFNKCLIICDDYQLTDSLETSNNPENLSDYEKMLTQIYPDSEILTVACLSGVNYHMYSLVKNGEKIRFKRISHGTPLIQFGKTIEEEVKVYSYSKIIEGQRRFRSTYKEDEIYDNTEDQMMEDFTFGVAKRHLGVMISTSEDDILLNTTLKKYSHKKVDQHKSQKEKSSTSASWFSRLFKKEKS